MKKPQNSTTLSKEIVDEITSNLQSLFSSWTKSNKYLKQFDAMSDATKIFVVEEVLQCESATITKAINNCETVYIPSLGSFKYRPSRKKAIDITNQIVKEFGFNKLSEITDVKIRTTVISEIQSRVKETLLSDYFKNHGGKSTKVLSGFKIPSNGSK